MSIDDIDICGKPAIECPTAVLIDAMMMLKTYIRQHAQQELRDLDSRRQILMDALNGDLPMPVPDEAPKAREVKPKYRHPKDMILTWSGRGKKPGWMQDWIAAGNDMKDLLIAE